VDDCLVIGKGDKIDYLIVELKTSRFMLKDCLSSEQILRPTMIKAEVLEMVLLKSF
jgi:hypothetical protein